MQNELGMRDVVRLVAPGVEIISSSHPEPVLRAVNVVAIYESEDDSRNAILALESIEDDDAAVGLSVLGHKRQSPGLQQEDPKIAGETVRRAAKGAAIGAVIGALVIGGGAALIDTGPALLGAMIGGALFGAFIGAVWGAFVRFGGSDAYRQSFVGTDDGVSLVSLHTDDERHAHEARELLAMVADVAPVVIRRDGGRIWTAD